MSGIRIRLKERDAIIQSLKSGVTPEAAHEKRESVSR